MTDETAVEIVPPPADGRQSRRTPSTGSYDTRQKNRFKRLLARRSSDSLLELDPSEIKDINDMSYSQLNLPGPSNDFF